jgi:hypothetical protein
MIPTSMRKVALQDNLEQYGLITAYKELCQGIDTEFIVG